MPLTKQAKNALPLDDSTGQKQQIIMFFKSYMKYLKKMLSHQNSQRDSQFNIFDLKKTSANVSLESFLQRILSYFKCGNQAYICALCFIDRFMQSESAKTENFQLTIKNIFKIISVALLISTKNFDDFYYANTYYARVCGLTLQQLNQLQKQFLKTIDFDVFINAEEYKIYQVIIENYKNSLYAQPRELNGKQNIGNNQNNQNSQNKIQLSKKSSIEQNNDSEITQEQDKINIEVEVSA